MDVEKFERLRFLVSILFMATSHVVIDEIGKMECLSTEFQWFVTKVLDRDMNCIATFTLNKPNSSFNSSPSIAQIPQKGRKKGV
jgi:nucleoside-triphosphatase THEP1